MHVVVISDNDNRGGAAIAAARLAEGLAEQNIRVTRIVAKLKRPTFTYPTITAQRFRIGRIAYRLGLGGIWEPVQYRIAAGALDGMLTQLRPDAISVHNLHSGIASGFSLGLLPVCTRHAPTVWTLHDMWSFTGRCAVSYACRKYLIGCDATCPTPREYPSLAPGRIAGAWASRRQVLADEPDLVAVTPSQWLAREARAGLWSSHQVEVIPNGLPLDVYRPGKESQVRATLGIKANGPVLLAVAENFTSRYRGSLLLVNALRRLTRQSLTLLTLGQGDGGFSNIAEGVHVHALGYVDDEATKVLAYEAADIYVHPALADNLPNGVVEALACGTPVVAFPVGGLPELVRPGQTGWLADEVSPEALAATIQRALQDLRSGIYLRDLCRSVAEAEYGVGLQASRYLELFRSLGRMN